jgi:Rieske 2Fe-2S family protein
MNEITPPAGASPLLDHCPESLPATWYHDPNHFLREQNAIWARHWIYAGRVADLQPLVVRRLSAGGQNLILVKDQAGGIACFHNTCRHRGAELCQADDTRLKSKLISCPYHEWAYDLQGRLVRVPYASPTADFRKEDHGLLKVKVREWNGFIFICLANDPPPFEAAPDMGVNALDNWPMADLATGHTMVKEIACNWKIFWENYNECLHCPGIHPLLCDMVPIYGKGLMAPNEAPDWQPGESHWQGALKHGARSWTMSGEPCGPEFPNLTDAQRNAGQTFVTLWPTMYVVAHVDYARTVSLRPLGPERTELRVEWLFPKETLELPDFDLENVTRFASTVVAEDSAASEMNQRGLKSSAFRAGRLMPQEFDVYRFQQWVRSQLA